MNFRRGSRSCHLIPERRSEKLIQGGTFLKIKTIIDEDFVNYKKPSMFIATAECDWKCCKECGKDICQNMQLAQMPNIEISPEAIIARF